MRALRSLFLSLLDYDQTTGRFIWKPGRAGVSGGTEAGSISTWGYRQIKINGKQYAAHRLAWFIVYHEWPARELDHINGDKLDNRITNLREATRSQNQAAISRHRDSAQPFKGVQRLPSGRWRAHITKDYKRRHVGVYDTPEEASAAYYEAASQLHGKFANAGGDE